MTRIRIERMTLPERSSASRSKRGVLAIVAPASASAESRSEEELRLSVPVPAVPAGSRVSFAADATDSPAGRQRRITAGCREKIRILSGDSRRLQGPDRATVPIRGGSLGSEGKQCPRDDDTETVTRREDPHEMGGGLDSIETGIERIGDVEDLRKRPSLPHPGTAGDVRISLVEAHLGIAQSRRAIMDGHDARGAASQEFI